MCVASVTAVEDIRCWYILFFYSHCWWELTFCIRFCFCCDVCRIQWTPLWSGILTYRLKDRNSTTRQVSFFFCFEFFGSWLNWMDPIRQMFMRQKSRFQWTPYKCGNNSRTVFNDLQNRMGKPKRSCRKMLFCWHGDDRVSTENQSGTFFSDDKGIECKSTSSSTLKTLDQFLG